MQIVMGGNDGWSMAIIVIYAFGFNRKWPLMVMVMYYICPVEVVSRINARIMAGTIPILFDAYVFFLFSDCQDLLQQVKVSIFQSFPC